MFSRIYILFLTINKNPKQIVKDPYKILKNLEKIYDLSIETPREHPSDSISFTEMFFRSKTVKFSAIGLKRTLDEAHNNAALQIMVYIIKSKDTSLQKLQNNLHEALLIQIQSHLNSFLKLNY